MSIYGAKFADENLFLNHSKRGVLSMANRGANTNSSQFFVTLKETPWLDGIHTVFGELVEGEETLDLVALGGSSSGEPTQYFHVKECGLIDSKV